MGACGSKKDTVEPVPGAAAQAAAAQPAAKEAAPTPAKAVTSAATTAAAAPKMVGGEYESADQLEDYSTFFTAESKSSLKRNLTEEIWNEYKDQTDDAGVTFKTMCFSGIKNQDSGIGLYAGSHGSYTKFNKLFDKVIQEYHGHAPDATHESNMDATGLTNADFSEEDSAMVNSTRIRVGRNCHGYPLGPGVSKE